MTETELIAQLRNARGQRFVKLFREADATIGERLRQEVNAKRASEGTVPIRFFGEMARRENLAVKTMFRMLEDGVALPSGTYEQMVAKHITPTRLLEAAK